MAVFIGTSGWAYPEWKNGFYAGVPRSGWLRHYAGRFSAVEVNATFYHSLRPRVLESWRDATPAGFRFSVKASRYLTHVRRLRVEADSLARLRDQADALGEKLAVVLWQAPGNLRCDLNLLAALADQLDSWDSTRHAVEFRHRSWFNHEVAARLTAHRIAAVQSHAAGWPMWDAVTTDLVYVRLHGGVRTYVSGYAPVTLNRWAERIKGWSRESRDVHVYFDNTAAGRAPVNARALRERTEAA